VRELPAGDRHNIIVRRMNLVQLPRCLQGLVGVLPGPESLSTPRLLDGLSGSSVRSIHSSSDVLGFEKATLRLSGD